MARTRKCAFAGLRGGNFPVRLVAIHISPDARLDRGCLLRQQINTQNGCGRSDQGRVIQALLPERRLFDAGRVRKT